MKRKFILSLFLAALMLTVSAVAVHAEAPRVLLDGDFLEVEAVIIDSRTLPPLRAVAEAVGAGLLIRIM